MIQDPLDRSVQEQLKSFYSEVKLEDCDNYHWINLPDGSTFKGEWDLRETWREYLGGFDFQGKRILEVGPAAGFLSLMMERTSAEIVCVEVPPNVPQDLISIPGVDDEYMQLESCNRIERFRKAWWYFHRQFGSSNKVVYTNVYNLPPLGRFDASVFASVLLHLANPYEALRQAAKQTDHTIILTDLHSPSVGDLMNFCPSNEAWHWWSLSPAVCKRMLETLGFPNQKVTFHEQLGQGGPAKFFTIVADR